MLRTRKFAPYVLGLLAVVLCTFGYYKISQMTSSAGIVCEQEYALCTSAPCIPDPMNPEKAICSCKVHIGKSFGMTSCKMRKPHTDANGVHSVTSTYSFVEYTKKKTMFCPNSSPWTFCLDKSCTVDPQDPSKAICTCDVKRTGQFLTLGGDCDTSTCSTGYWSGATLDDVNTAMPALMKAMGLKSSPNNYCPNTPPPK